VDHDNQRRPLVGRAAELVLLEDVAAQARTAFRLVEVVGEPGAGKTRLLAEFTKKRLVLRGRAVESEREVPFAPLVDALVDRVDAALADKLSEPETQLLATAFPVLSKKPAHEVVKPRLYRAMRSLLRELAPVTVVLDDVHWADESTIELVDYLVRHPLPAPMLLLRTLPERLGLRRDSGRTQGRVAAEHRRESGLLQRLLAGEARAFANGRRIAFGASCILVATRRAG